MKLKLLLMPTLILVLILVLWLVYPAFTNGTDGLKEKYQEMKTEQAKLDDLLEKKANILVLSAELDARAEEKKVLYDFVPASREDEEIIESLNFFAFNSGLSIFGISVVKGQAVSVARSAEAVENQEAILPQVQNISVELQLAGGYEKMKEFIANIGRLERYNNFSVVRISKDRQNREGNPAASNFLVADLTVDFNVLENATFTQGHLENPVFSSKKLDFKIVSDIKEKRNSAVPTLNIDQRSRQNPFSL
jgi:Tfp pilus assembly protein PilO